MIMFDDKNGMYRQLQTIADLSMVDANGTPIWSEGHVLAKKVRNKKGDKPDKQIKVFTHIFAIQMAARILQGLHPNVDLKAEENWPLMMLLAQTIRQFWAILITAAENQYPIDMLLNKALDRIHLEPYNMWTCILETKREALILAKAAILSFIANRSEPSDFADITLIPGENMPKNIAQDRILSAWRLLALDGDGTAARIQTMTNSSIDAEEDGVTAELISGQYKANFDFELKEQNEVSAHIMSWFHVGFMYIVSNHDDHCPEDITFHCSSWNCETTREKVGKIERLSPKTLFQKPDGETPKELFDDVELAASYSNEVILDGIADIKLISASEQDDKLLIVPCSSAIAIVKQSRLKSIHAFAARHTDISAGGEDGQRWGERSPMNENYPTERIAVHLKDSSPTQSPNRRVNVVDANEGAIKDAEGGFGCQTDAEDMATHAAEGLINGHAGKSHFLACIENFGEIFDDQANNTIITATQAAQALTEIKRLETLQAQLAAQLTYKRPISKLARLKHYFQRLNPGVKLSQAGLGQWIEQWQVDDAGSISSVEEGPRQDNTAVKAALEAIPNRIYLDQWQELTWDQMGDGYIFPGGTVTRLTRASAKEQTSKPTKTINIGQDRTGMASTSIFRTFIPGRQIKPLDTTEWLTISAAEIVAESKEPPLTFIQKPGEEDTPTLASMLRDMRLRSKFLLEEEESKSTYGHQKRLPNRLYSSEPTKDFAMKIANEQRFDEFYAAKKRTDGVNDADRRKTDPEQHEKDILKAIRQNEQKKMYNEGPDALTFGCPNKKTKK